MGSLDFLFAELPDFVKMLCELFDRDGFMVDALVLMLMI